MDGVQRILVLSFTAWMRNASRGREAPEEWASLLLFQSRHVESFLIFFLGLTLFANPAEAASGMNIQNALPPPPAIDKNSPLYKAAKGMEVHFMQEMLKNMRKTVPESPELEGSKGYTVFREMLDDHYAETAARTQGIGLAEMIVKQVMEQQAAQQATNAQVRAREYTK